MSSPCRISCRESDSSNKAAKFSDEGVDMLCVAVAMTGWFPKLSCNRLTREPCVSRGRAGCRNPLLEHGLDVFAEQPHLLPLSRHLRLRRRSNLGRCRARPVQVEHEIDRGLDSHARGIQDDGVGRGLERCGRPARVACVALSDVAQKTLNGTRDSFFDQLLMPTTCPLLRARADKYLQKGVGEDHRSHVPAVGDKPGRAPKRPLSFEKRPSNRLVD